MEMVIGSGVGDRRWEGDGGWRGGGLGGSGGGEGGGSFGWHGWGGRRWEEGAEGVDSNLRLFLSPTLCA